MLIVCPTCASEYNVDATHLGSEGRRVRCFNCHSHWFAQPVEDVAPLAEIAGQSAMAGLSTQEFLDEEWQRAALDDPDVAQVAQDTAGAPDEAKDDASSHTAETEAGIQPDSVNQNSLPAAPRRKPQGRNSRARPALRGRPPVLAPAAIAALCGALVIVMCLWQRDVLVRAAPSLAGPLERIGLSVNVRGLEFEKVTSELVSDPSGRFLVVQSMVRNVTSRQVDVPMIEVVVRDTGAKPVYTWATEPPRASLAPGESLSFRTRLAAPPQDGNDVILRFQRSSGHMSVAQK